MAIGGCLVRRRWHRLQRRRRRVHVLAAACVEHETWTARVWARFGGQIVRAICMSVYRSARVCIRPASQPSECDERIEGKKCLQTVHVNTSWSASVRCVIQAWVESAKEIRCLCLENYAKRNGMDFGTSFSVRFAIRNETSVSDLMLHVRMNSIWIYLHTYTSTKTGCMTMR